MNMHISSYTAADIARMGVPWGHIRDDAHPGCFLALDSDEAIKADSLGRLAREFHGALTRCEITVDAKSNLAGRTDAARADSAAEVFWTNTLEQTLTSIVRQPKTSGVMTGPDAVLPIRATLRPGQIAGVYDVETTTGQAAFVEPDGARKLPMVGEFAERKRYQSHWFGIGYGVGMVEMWRAAEMGKPLEQMRRMTAESALQRFAERALLYGDAGHELIGLLQNTQAHRVSLASNFTSLVADPDAAQVRLQIMEKAFKVIGETYSPDAQITGVVAPMDDLRALQRMRWSNDTPALPDFRAMHPWLNNVRWIEHIQASGPNGGNQWVLWSDDANELWAGLNPTPMLFGPWQDSNTGMRQAWGMIQQIEGVINRRRERMAVFEFAA